MNKIALGVCYEGTSWMGWQTQPHRRTVQDTLEQALLGFLGHKTPTICAGRTDTGVHAAMQVVHLETPLHRPEQAWVRGLNTLLPPSIGIRWAHAVDAGFHARFSAQSRTYVYRLLESPVRSPLWAGRTGWSFRPLDLAAMQEAASALVGRHDFSSFRSSQCQAATPVRELTLLDLERHGRFILITLQANAFLHHMVRNMVGALVYVGQGRQPPGWMPALLAERDRRRAAPTFAADGLTLTGVEYDPAFGLPEINVTDEVKYCY